MRGHLFFVAGLLALLVSDSAAARKWTNRAGEVLYEAEFVELKGELVTLQQADGRTIQLPLAALAAADQAIVAQLMPVQPDKEPAEKAKLDPQLIRQLLDQIGSNNADEVRRMIAAEPGLVNSEVDNDTPLLKAARAGLQEMVRVLIESGADVDRPNSNGATPLLDAVKQAGLKIVQMLLAEGADPTVTDGDGQTLLHRAATKEIAALLLSLQADIEAVTEHNETPLHTALRAGNLDVAQLLIDRGANIEATDDRESRPIHVACQTVFSNALAMVEMLLAENADLNALGLNGSTVLHEAAMFNQLQLVPLFIERGIDIDAKNRLGETALDLAKQAGNVQMIALLRNLGAIEQ